MRPKADHEYAWTGFYDTAPRKNVLVEAAQSHYSSPVCPLQHDSLRVLAAAFRDAAAVRMQSRSLLEFSRHWSYHLVFVTVPVSQIIIAERTTQDAERWG